ncbi:MAG TPA: hypothetical protein VNZ86_09985 [Bacteroidia bacterium]|jgi:hypothetical protein|nr:hypothetical protein [Bacteroidia bacterium]
MNRLKYYFLIPLLVLVCLGFKAQQAPGYRGHRFYLLYDFQFHPDISHYTPSLNPLINSNATYPATPILYSHALGAEYVYNRHASLGLSAQFLSFQGKYTPLESDYSGSGYYLSIYIRHFKARKEAIAPLGKYQKPEISILYYSGNGSSMAPTFHSGPLIGFSYSVGRTYILFNHLVVDRGIRFSLLDLYHATAIRDGGKQSADPAAGAVLNNQYINLYVGIGILP